MDDSSKEDTVWGVEGRELEFVGQGGDPVAVAIYRSWRVI